MPSNEFMMALNALCHERDLSKDVVLEAIEKALQAAYRKDFEQEPNIAVEMDRKSGEARVYVDWTVVDEVQDEHSELSLEEARSRFGDDVEVGDVVREERTPQHFGRIAAQTAKQVILQRIREAEQDRAYHEYASREGEIVMGTVQSIDSRSGLVRLSLGKAEAILPRSEQLPGERYRVGQRVRGYVAEVNKKNNGGPQITLSRTHRHMLRRLLELEVPEIANGTVEIRAIAREAGARSKIAVAALQPGIDPVGACVGMKGIRIQSIVNELNGEKIDVVQWSPDEALYVANALSPAKVIETFLDESNEEGKTAIVVVPDKQLSLAIGKEGQNARLAAKLTGWRIDIKSASEAADERVRLAEREARRREELARRRAEEEARIAAARALLAEAEAVDKTEDEEEEPMVAVSPADAIAFEELEGSVSAEVEVPAVDEAERQAETPAVVEEEAPAAPPAKPEPPVRAPEPVQPAAEEPEWEEYEDEEEEEEETPAPSKPAVPSIFYTLNDRGEAESLDDTVQRQKRQKKGKKKKGREDDRRGWEQNKGPREQGKPRRTRRPWSEENNW
ncbi:MAG: transcription termination factor NusA [Chloroflexota bacterium]|nr:transcription termination factor NusA [Chloroflexota bacterium]